MTFEDQLRDAIRSRIDSVAPPPPDAESVMGRQRRVRNPRVIAIPVAVMAIVGGILGGTAIIDDESTSPPAPEPLGQMDFSHGLRAYASPGGPVSIGGRRFDGSDLEHLDTAGAETPYGIVYFDDGQAYLLDEQGRRTSIGPKPDEIPEAPPLQLDPDDPREEFDPPEPVFHPSAQADATRPLAAWTEYYTDHVIVRAYDFAAGESIGTYDVECGSECAGVNVDAVDNGYVFIDTGDGTYAWNALEDDDLTQVAGPDTEVVEVHAKTMLYSGKAPDPEPGGPIDDSWRFVKGAIDAQLSHDGRYILYWSPKLKPVRDGDEPIRLDAKGLQFFALDTDGSVLAATRGNPAKVYDCVLPSGKCTRLEDLPTKHGAPIFIGNDM